MRRASAGSNASYSEDGWWVFKLSITSTIRSLSGSSSSTSCLTTRAQSTLVRRSVTSTRRHPSSGANNMKRLLTPLRWYS